MIEMRTLTNLQFDKIKQAVIKRAIGEYTKQRLEQLQPQTQLTTVEVWQQETQEARWILDSNQQVPFMGLNRINRLVEQLEKGLILTAGELIEFADFLRSNRLIAQFFAKNQVQTPLLFAYSRELLDFSTSEEEIYQKIHYQKLTDDASKNLRRIRKQKVQREREIMEKLVQLQVKYRSYLQDKLIVKKQEHYTLSIKASYKNKINGMIIEESAKGQTAFIEPTSVAKLNHQLELLLAEEAAEEYQILAGLTGILSDQLSEIKQALEIVTAFDLIFARGKYSRELNGITPKLNQNEEILLKGARHPLLEKSAVPLDFSLGKDYRGLVITGVNAGGKTVVLKTVGLLTLMAQFGLQIPAAPESELTVVKQLFVDIGDQQDLSNSLSTFSGHMQTVAQILNRANRHTLVLLDEIGSGTEPNEGAGLAIAIMEELYQKGALIVATTHYGEIKRYAFEHEDFIPAAMAFDRETLTPLYRLQVGQVGDSQALWIAKKMRMNDRLIKKAAEYSRQGTYPQTKKVFLSDTVKAPISASIFETGDRVLLNETGEIGLVYTDEGGETVTIFVADELRDIYRKRVTLKAHAVDLYPADYDKQSLFVVFEKRKAERDLLRGSKKAQRRLSREARERKNKNIRTVFDKKRQK